MNRKTFLGVVLGIFCLSGVCQNRVDSSYYYYYKGEKQYIALNTKQAMVILPAAELSKRTKSGGIDRVKELNHKDCSEIAFSDSLSPKDYLEQLAELENNLNVRIRGYFISRNDDKLCISDFFYVCLKDLSDSTLLYSMAAELSVEVVSQDRFLPHWFTLKAQSLQMDSQLRTVNRFYESGLFQAAEPEFFTDKSMRDRKSVV